MEAETYLSSGYGLRLEIQRHPEGWKRLGEFAEVLQPSRLKGTVVAPEHGTPFLAATQVFDVRPIARRYLAIDKVPRADELFVKAGTILVTRSGSVGRTALAFNAHEGVLISDDLLRVYPRDRRDYGWLYAFLHAPQARAMMVSAQYGHIIKHLEPSHLKDVPVPIVPEELAHDFNHRVDRILGLRNEAYRLTLEAEALFERALGPLRVTDWGEQGFTTRVSQSILKGRRRFEASFHSPGVVQIRRHLECHGCGFVSIADSGYDVWLPPRFRRIPASDGVTLAESSALTEVNPDFTKKIADGDFGDPYRGRVEPGWVLLARSGQTYGILGTAVLAGKHLEGLVVSDDVIRMKPHPEPAIRPGYLVTALSHPIFGRPLVKSLAYGSGDVPAAVEFRGGLFLRF